MTLEIRRSNRGINGEPVLFYARRAKPAASKVKTSQKREKAKATTPQLSELVKGVRKLGLKSASVKQVDAVLRHLYPSGTDGIETRTLLTPVFLELTRRATSDQAPP